MTQTGKLFVSTIIVCMLACSADADIVYTTSNGKMGYIAISKTLSADAPAVKYSGFAGGSFAAHFYTEGGSSRIVLIEHESDTKTASGDKALVFDASNLETPISINDESDSDSEIILTGAYHVNSAAYSDNHRSIFLASALNGRPRVSEFDSGSMELVRDYTYNASSDEAYISTVLVDGGNVYCLVKNATSQDSTFLRFDGQLRDDTDDYTSLRATSGAELIAYGKDHKVYLGHSGGVDILNSGKFLGVISSDNPVKAICRDKDNGFYYIAQGSDGKQSLRHYKDITTIKELASGTSESSVSKALCYDTDGKKFAAFIVNDRILICNMEDDSITAEFTSSALGGVPVSIMAGTQNTTSTNDSDSGGCNVTGAGIMLTLLAVNGMLLSRQSKRR